MANNVDHPEQLSKSLLADFEELAAECQRLCHITRAKELQTAHLPRMAAFLEMLADLKRDAIVRADENAANLLLSFESLIEALASQLRMWIALKDDDPSQAWRHLIHAQMAARDAIVAHEMGTMLNAPRYLERLLALERVLFPPQLFFSVGAEIEYAQCSICKQEYGSCDHLVGRVYMGQFCIREVTRAKLREVSLATEPANKTCRALSITDQHGVQRDTMTWREMPRELRRTAETPTEDEVQILLDQSEPLSD